MLQRDGKKVGAIAQRAALEDRLQLLDLVGHRHHPQLGVGLLGLERAEARPLLRELLLPKGIDLLGVREGVLDPNAVCRIANCSEVVDDLVAERGHQLKLLRRNVGMVGDSS